MTETTLTRQFEFTPQEITFKFIDNHDLAELVIKHTDVTLEQLSMVCKWWSDKQFEHCFNCNKGGKPVLNLGEERDFITLLVQQGVLPEGNYLVRIKG